MMLRLFTLLTLSFLSAQSFAGSCPDGSEPVKSISADGTYFVYNCGGNDDTKSSNSLNSELKSYEDLDLTSIPKNILSKGNTQSLWNAYQTASECFMHPTYGEGFGYQLKKISQNDFKKNEWITPFFTLDESRKHEIQLTGKTPKPIVTVKLDETYGEENEEVNRAREFFKKAAYVARIGNSDLEVQKVKTVLLDWAKNDALKEGINVSWGDKPVDWQMMMLINAILTTTATMGENINAEERQIIGPWLNGLVQKVAKSNWKDRQDNKAYLTSYMTLIWGLMVNDLNAVQNSIDVVKLAIHDMRPDGSLPIDTQRGGMGIKYNSDSFAYLLMMASILEDVTGKDLFSYKADGRSLLNGVNFVIKSVKMPSKTNSIYAISCPGGGDRWGSIKNPSKYHIETSTYLLVYAYRFPNDENSDYLINKYGGTFNQPKLRIRSKPSGIFTLHPMLISSRSELFHSQTGEVIDRFGGISEIPESANPNDETLKYYLFRYLYSFNKYPFCSPNNKQLHCESSPPQFTHSIEPSNNPSQFESNLREDRYIKKQMQDTPLLSYLLYEDGKILIDEKTPKDRFGDMYRDSSKFHSQSVGKTLVSYVAGHAICEGYIDSVDSRLNDWPVLENTLYHNQKLIDILNMAAGTQNYFDGANRFTKSTRPVTSPVIQDIMKSELRGSKQSYSQYHYNNLNPILVMSYILYRAGDENFQELLDDVFQKKARIESDVFFLKNERAKKDDISVSNQFYATRYDYLRIAKAMLDDWENDTCVGKYLKTIHERRINKGNWGGKPGTRVTLPEAYAGFFHTGYVGMANRPVMGMDGYGGQTILIDFERGRIIATQAIHDNMMFPESGGIDFKKISYERIKNGKHSSKAISPSEVVLNSQQIIKKRNAAIETERIARQYWYDYYDCNETSSGKSNIQDCIDKTAKKRKKAKQFSDKLNEAAEEEKEDQFISEKNELFKNIKSSDALDGYYSFTLMEPPMSGLGHGTIEINQGIVTITQDSKGTVAPSYDSFEGRIDQNGDIKALFYFHPCKGCEDQLVEFEGNLNKKKLSGKYKDLQIYFYLTAKKGDVIKTVSKTQETKTAATKKIETSDSDPTISRVIEVTHGDKLIVDIAEPHELAGSNIKISLKDIDAPDATRSCPKQMELGAKVRDFVEKKLENASSIKLTNFRKTNTKIISQVIVDGVDLGEELVSKGYASEEYGFWKPYFCSALSATNQADQYHRDGDSNKAIFWYERSIVLDPNGSKNQQSYFLLSKMYSDLGDNDKSLESLKKSASLEWVPAMEQLGSDYLNGNGVKKDPNQGKKWLKKAFDKGSQRAEDIYCGSLPKAKQKTCKF